jgi:hypothetical protein
LRSTTITELDVSADGVLAEAHATAAQLIAMMLTALTTASRTRRELTPEIISGHGPRRVNSAFT